MDQIPRRKGEFLWAQAEAARAAGAEALDLAMFDELDKGTALFNITRTPPVGDSPFLDLEELPSDHYLWLSGEIARRLRLGSKQPKVALPDR